MICKYIELPSVENKYQRLAALGLELGIPVMECHLEMQVVMPGGRITHWHRQRSHSWTRNAYNYLLCSLDSKAPSDATTFAAGKLNAKDTGGGVRNSNNPFCFVWNTATPDTPSAGGSGNGYLATATLNTKGIIIGTSIQAESFEDFALIGIVANGSGAGQLAYTASSNHSISYDTPSKTWTDSQIRFFNNNSGGTIGVNEVGLIADIAVGGTVYNVMMSRDHLANTVNVLDTGQLKVTYTISLAYPS